MEEVLIQGDTAGAAASPPCPFDAARREPPLPRHAATVLAPAWRRPVGAAAPAPRRLRVCPYVDKNQEATTMEDIAAHCEAPRRPHTSRSSARRHELAQAPRSPCLEDSTVAESDSNGTASDANTTITGLGPELARHRRRGPPAPPRKQAPLLPP